MDGTQEASNRPIKDMMIAQDPGNEVESVQTRTPQKSFTQYAIEMALDQIDALSDGLIAIQASTYEVEKDTITSLAFLMREKTHNIKALMAEMAQEKRSLEAGEPPPPGQEEGPAVAPGLEKKNLLLEAMIRWYERESKSRIS